LYNLAADLSERNDLASEHPEKVEQLQAAWEKWNAELAPPAWRGPDPPQVP